MRIRNEGGPRRIRRTVAIASSLAGFDEIPDCLVPSLEGAFGVAAIPNYLPQAGV